MQSMNIKFPLLTISLSVALVGCQSVPKAPSIANVPPIAQQSTTNNDGTVVALPNFQITGKIGVRTPQQNGSAFYGWTQIGENFAIDLTGALGIGQTSIRGKAGDVTLTSSKTGVIQAETPEELLFKATGWEAPITYLISWINAQPASPAAVTEKDTTGRIISLHEGGWSAKLSYLEQQNTPNKLILVDDEQQNRVTLTIQTRQ